LLTRIHKELKKLNSPKIKASMKKWANELNRALTKEQVQMAKHTNKNINKCSVSLAIKKMQIKTKLKIHLTPVRMGTIKNTKNNVCEDAGKNVN
jgi:hypothetical protein